MHLLWNLFETCATFCTVYSNLSRPVLHALLFTQTFWDLCYMLYCLHKPVQHGPVWGRRRMDVQWEKKQRSGAGSCLACPEVTHGQSCLGELPLTQLPPCHGLHTEWNTTKVSIGYFIVIVCPCPLFHSKLFIVFILCVLYCSVDIYILYLGVLG